MSIEVRPSLDALQALDWAKGDGLLPAVVQDADTLQVLMLGYVSAESLAATLAIGHMTFFSRSKQRLWTKGEQSGNVLVVQSISVDCDADTLLVMARPAGPTCHTGAESCFDQAPKDFLGGLGQLVAMREAQRARGDKPRYDGRWRPENRARLGLVPRLRRAFRGCGADTGFRRADHLRLSLQSRPRPGGVGRLRVDPRLGRSLRAGRRLDHLRSDQPQRRRSQSHPRRRRARHPSGDSGDRNFSRHDGLI